MARRAYGAEDKKVRRDDILDAARRLFVGGAGELPSVASIADAAGLAKGTVYLYFRTKEAIFADLLLAGWADVLGILEDVFATVDDPAGKVSGFVARFTRYLDGHPALLRLDALGHEIERNLGPEALQAFKHDLNGRLDAAGAVVERVLGLPRGRGVQLLIRTYALTRGLWLTVENDADLPSGRGRIVRAEFRDELAEALTEYWRGALATSMV